VAGQLKFRRVLQQTAYLRAICKIVLREVNLAKGAFPDEPAECIIPDVSQVFRIEFSRNWSATGSFKLDCNILKEFAVGIGKL
jgi:hypothetical protein